MWTLTPIWLTLTLCDFTLTLYDCVLWIYYVCERWLHATHTHSMWHCTHHIRPCIVNIAIYTHMWMLTPRNSNSLYLTLHPPYTTVYCEYRCIYSYVKSDSTQLTLTVFDFTLTLYDCVLWILLYILICERWLHATRTHSIWLDTHPIRLKIVLTINTIRSRIGWA